MRKSYTSGASWEEKVGYTRAVKIGNIIEVSGTTAMKDGVLVGKNNAYAQAHCIFTIIKEAIEGLGGQLEDVIRTRMYVTDINHWEEVGSAHGDFFKTIKPVTTLVEVSRLIDPNMLVEIEATAVTNEAKV